MRRVLPILLVLTLLAGSWVRPAATRGAEDPAATAPRIFGVSVRGELADPAVRDLLQQAGITWMRTSVSWSSVQPAPGAWNWAGLDSEVRNVAAAGGTPIVLVMNNPAWAATTTCGPIDRVPLDTFAEFVRALAGRYNGATVDNGSLLPRVDHWEFYNEPDNMQMAEEWIGGCWGSHGADYAQMLAAAWPAIHRANPQAKILFGPVAAEYVTYNNMPLFNFNLAGGDFVDDVLSYMHDHPQSTYFDVFTFHYFPAFHARWDSFASGLIGKTHYYRNRMMFKGIDRPMMCTETGRRSDAGQVIDGIPGSDEEQSRYVVRLFAQGMAAGLQALSWFNLGDVPQDGGYVPWGLLDSGNHPKPSYTAMRVLVQQLGAATFSRTSNLVDVAEGYVFSLTGGGERSVVWARGTGMQFIVFPGSQVHTTDKWGNERTYQDGQAGDEDWRANGVIVLRIGGSPKYVDRAPNGVAHLSLLYLPLIVKTTP